MDSEYTHELYRTQVMGRDAEIERLDRENANFKTLLDQAHDRDEKYAALVEAVREYLVTGCKPELTKLDRAVDALGDV